MREDKKFDVMRFLVGPLDVNAYLVIDKATKEAFLVDPGGDPREIKEAVKKSGADLKFIINTHGHGDHIIADDSFGVPLYIHKDDARFLKDPYLNLSGDFGLPLKIKTEPKLLSDGDTIPIGNSRISIIHTPGHTPGGICIVLGNIIFTGDTLFSGSIGRTDFPDGNQEKLLMSINKRLLKFKDDTLILPGHGGSSTIGEERVNNPFLGDDQSYI